MQSIMEKVVANFEHLMRFAHFHMWNVGAFRKLCKSYEYSVAAQQWPFVMQIIYTQTQVFMLMLMHLHIIYCGLKIGTKMLAK